MGLTTKVLEPSLEVLKRLPIGDVINQKGTYTTPIVVLRDAPEGLLTSSVPNLQFDLGSILNLNNFRSKVYSNCLI